MQSLITTSAEVCEYHEAEYIERCAMCDADVAESAAIEQAYQAAARNHWERNEQLFWETDAELRMLGEGGL